MKQLKHKGTRALQNELAELLAPELFLEITHYEAFSKLVGDGKLAKQDNPQHHCCVIFVPYNPVTKEIFIVHHKKAKQWVVPGGHVEEGELLMDALRREVREELGIILEKEFSPFLFSVMYIYNEGYLCAGHYDSWFFIPTEELSVNLTEFNEVKWVPIAEAKKIITLETYLQALSRLPIENV